MQTRNMGQAQTLGPALRLRQHLGRDVDPGHPGIRPEMRKRQTGADPDLEDPLPWPIIGDAYRVLAPRMEDRTKEEVVRTRKKAVGPDRVAQLHRFAFVVIDRTDANDRRVIFRAAGSRRVS